MSPRALQSLYTDYENGTTPSYPGLEISGNDVEISIQLAPSTGFDAALSQLQSDGMQVSTSSANYNLIEGMMPISALSDAASIGSSVTPVYAPSLH